MEAEKLWKGYQNDMVEWQNLSNYDRWKRARTIKKEAKQRRKLLDFANSRKRVG